MKIAIVIPTYFRRDKRSRLFLDRCLKSIKWQTHNDYKVFLIGDKYEDTEEFNYLSTRIIDPEKIYWENLSYAKERDLYYSDLEKLWCSGGVNAINYGIEKALSEGYEYICRIDHDDYWAPDHLEKISKFVENNQDYVLVCSYSLYLNRYIVPVGIEGTTDYYPEVGNLVHSSTCIKFSDMDIRYRDCFSEIGEVKPADADLWERMSDFMRTNNLKGKLLEGVSVYLDKVEKS